jgi:two-component system, sensor histidine kinase ChiS
MLPPVAPIIAELTILWIDDMAFNRVFYRQSEVVKPMPYRILVVDDYEMNLLLMAKILELEGYQVKLASNGIEAIQSVLKNKPDLAILDVKMPDMDGYELCRKLRQPPLNTTGPIILLTAMNCEMEKGQAVEAGANDIWSKPFDLELFRQRIGELLTVN